MQEQEWSDGGTVRIGAQQRRLPHYWVSPGIWECVSEGEELCRRAVEWQLRGQRLLATHWAYISHQGRVHHPPSNIYQSIPSHLLHHQQVLPQAQAALQQVHPLPRCQIVQSYIHQTIVKGRREFGWTADQHQLPFPISQTIRLWQSQSDHWGWKLPSFCQDLHREASLAGQPVGQSQLRLESQGKYPEEWVRPLPEPCQFEVWTRVVGLFHGLLQWSHLPSQTASKQVHHSSQVVKITALIPCPAEYHINCGQSDRVV